MNISKKYLSLHINNNNNEIINKIINKVITILCQPKYYLLSIEINDRYIKNLYIRKRIIQNRLSYMFFINKYIYFIDDGFK